MLLSHDGIEVVADLLFCVVIRVAKEWKISRYISGNFPWEIKLWNFGNIPSLTLNENLQELEKEINRKLIGN